MWRRPVCRCGRWRRRGIDIWSAAHHRHGSARCRVSSVKKHGRMFAGWGWCPAPRQRAARRSALAGSPGRCRSLSIARANKGRWRREATRCGRLRSRRLAEQRERVCWQSASAWVEHLSGAAQSVSMNVAIGCGSPASSPPNSCCRWARSTWSCSCARSCELLQESRPPRRGVAAQDEHRTMGTCSSNAIDEVHVLKSKLRVDCADGAVPERQ